MNELRPCPFCGYPAGLYVNESGVCVCCVNEHCEISTPFQADTYRHDDYIAMRNKMWVELLKSGTEGLKMLEPPKELQDAK